MVIDSPMVHWRSLQVSYDTDPISKTPRLVWIRGDSQVRLVIPFVIMVWFDDIDPSISECGLTLVTLHCVNHISCVVSIVISIQARAVMRRQKVPLGDSGWIRCTFATVVTKSRLNHDVVDAPCI